MTSLWERVRTGGKTGFDKTWHALDKVGAPVNRLSNKLGSEAFWPTTLDKECDKAARILKSFCKDGFYAEEAYQPQDGPKLSQKVVKKIPAKVIQNAKGLAIFTTMRTGLWFSGAGGSGILIARKEDGSWSPPSGILLHTAGLGFMVGIDIYDCVVVINTEQALEAFYKVRCTLGSEISVAAGPVGAGGVLETELHKRQAPVFTYMKSRGFYAGVQIDGTVIIERTDENERFYGQRIAVKDILSGQVRHPPFEVNRLLETIKAAQGTAFDASALPSEPSPSDFDIDDGRVFSVPDRQDPDPYGVLALEKAGMHVVEAGTHEGASWEQFSFNPVPSSPVHNIYNRNSIESRRALSTRSSWRGSVASATTPTRPTSLTQSVDIPKKSGMVDSSTQTELGSESPLSPVINGLRHSISRRSSKASVANSLSQQMQDVPEDTVLEASAKDTGYTTPPTTPPLYESDHEEVEIVQPVMQSVQAIKPAATQVVSKARLVTVAKRVPPRLPPRNPKRATESPTGRTSDDLSSPTHDEERSLESKVPEMVNIGPAASQSSEEELARPAERDADALIREETHSEISQPASTTEEKHNIEHICNDPHDERSRPATSLKEDNTASHPRNDSHEEIFAYASAQDRAQQDATGLEAHPDVRPMNTALEDIDLENDGTAVKRLSTASSLSKSVHAEPTALDHVDSRENDITAIKRLSTTSNLSRSVHSMTTDLDHVNLRENDGTAIKRFSTTSNLSSTSSTWDKVRAMRAIDDED